MAGVMPFESIVHKKEIMSLEQLQEIKIESFEKMKEIMDKLYTCTDTGTARRTNLCNDS